MILIKKGDKGPNIKNIQIALDKAGFWPYAIYSNYFGTMTDTAVRNFQRAKGIIVDGKVGKETANLLHVYLEIQKLPTNKGFDEKYKNVIITGSVFPDSPIRSNVKIKLNKELVDEYIPEMRTVMSDTAKGFQLLLEIMTYREGFQHKTRSYEHNNPGNIGNTDNGANVTYPTLRDGIKAQRKYFEDIVAGKHKAYKIDKEVSLKPYFSPEIAKHTKLYGISPWLPGYDFTYTGQLDQFIKIYSTGARLTNNYMSDIISFFKQNGLIIGPESKIQDIIKMR